MSARLTRLTHPRAVPWGNGLGESREWLAEFAPGQPASEGALLWRVATTSILSDCDFSHYPGYRRTIVLLSDSGFSLDFGPHGAAALDRPLASAEFLGGWPTYCTLARSTIPAQVLNVMTSVRLPRHALKIIALGIAPTRQPVDGASKLLFCAKGTACVQAGEQRLSMAEGEAFAIDCDAASFLLLSATAGTAQLLLIEVDGAPEAAASIP
jgi:environmental stress-induced protein Ves